MNERPFVALSIGVLTISDTRTDATDKSGQFIVEHLAGAGHRIVEKRIVPDDVSSIQHAFEAWQQQHVLDVLISTGGTGITERDITIEAFKPFVSKEIEGFGELFRWLSYEDIGAACIQSRAFAALCGKTLLFALPGSTGAVRLALEKIIGPQLDNRSKPCNFSMLLPRIRGRAPG